MPADGPLGPPLHVLADPTRLRQVLINLLSNAVKYNRDGGRVEVSARAAGGTVAIEVADTGHGFDETQRSQLFEPFNRLGLERGPIEGTGIGLAIVKALVEHMGGRVEAESAPGRGSVFRVWLPAAKNEARAEPADAAAAAGAAGTTDRGEHGAAAAPASSVPGAGRQRLLYIEDNPVNALIIRELVARRADIELRVAATGLAGLREAATWQPRLVLLDMQLPDLDGFEVLRRLRAAPATRATPVVALSANAMPDDIGRAMAGGLEDYWTKPLDFPLFLDRLQRWFGPAPD